MQQQTAKVKKVFKMSPCPAEERMCDYYDVPDAYEVATRTGSEGEHQDDSGVTYQRCNGGRRIIRKKIGGS